MSSIQSKFTRYAKKQENSVVKENSINKNRLGNERFNKDINKQI